MTRKEKTRAAVGGTLEWVPIEKLVPTPDNGRRALSDAPLRALARSIRETGLLHPLVVRVHPTQPGCYEIRAGERRWRAAKLAGLERLPVLVRSLGDAAALAVTLAENLERQDLHPLEEAATIQQALERELDLKAIASRLGRSVPYLLRRASLTHLSEVWRREIRRPHSEAGRLSAAH